MNSFGDSRLKWIHGYTFRGHILSLPDKREESFQMSYRQEDCDSEKDGTTTSIITNVDEINLEVLRLTDPYRMCCL